jgi:hypothetical protein
MYEIINLAPNTVIGYCLIGAGVGLALLIYGLTSTKDHW